MAAHNADTQSLANVIASSNQTPIQPLFTYMEVATALKVSVQTVEMWVKRGKIPAPVYIGVTARFTLAHLEEIYTGVKPAHTFPVTDSPRATQSRGGKTKKREAKLKAARKITSRPHAGVRSKARAGKGGGK